MQIGNVLKAWRESQHLNIRDAARLFGVSHSTLSRIERGFSCDGETLIRILKWLLSSPN